MRPNTPSEKNKNRAKVVLRLGKYLFRHPFMTLGAVILAIIGNGLAVLGPRLAGNAIDAIGTQAGQADFDKVFYYCGLMLVFYLVSSALSYILAVLMVKLSQKVVYQMRKEVFEKLMDLPVRFFDEHQTGDIISRLSYDIDTVNASLSNDFLQIISTAIIVGGSFTMMLRISPKMMLVFLVTIPVSILFILYRTRTVKPCFASVLPNLGN